MIDFLRGRGWSGQLSKKARCPLPGCSDVPTSKAGAFHVDDVGGEGKYKCFRCQDGGTLVDLVAAVKGVSLRDAMDEVLGPRGVDGPLIQGDAARVSPSSVNPWEIRTPEGLPAVPADFHVPAVVVKGKRLDWGAPDVTYTLRGPDFPDGVPFYRWHGRDGLPKQYRWATGSGSAKLPRRVLLVNDDEGPGLVDKGTVIVVEGPKDGAAVAALGYRVIGLCGQVAPFMDVFEWALRRACVKRVVLWPDAEKSAGADPKAAECMESVGFMAAAAGMDEIAQIDPLGFDKAASDAADCASIPDRIAAARTLDKDLLLRRLKGEADKRKSKRKGKAKLPTGPDGLIDGTQFDVASKFAARAPGRLYHNVDRDEWVRFADKDGWERVRPQRIAHEIAVFAAAAAARVDSPGVQRSLQTIGTVNGVTSFVKNRLAISVSESFDVDPHLVGLPDGKLFDIRTGEVRPAVPEDRVLSALGVVPRRGPAKVFTRFLADTFSSKDVAAYLMRDVGYAATGFMCEERALLFLGPNNTGKSTLLGVFEDLFAGYSRAVPCETFIRTRFPDHQTIRANLDGPRVVYCHEFPENAVIDDVVFNTAVDGNRFAGRFMHGDYFEFNPRCKLFLATNYRLRVASRMAGVARRLRVVPFLNQRDEGTGGSRPQDHSLRSKLRDELPEIAWLVLRAAHDWFKAHERKGQGLLPEPAPVRRATAEFFEESDRLGAFVADSLELDPAAVTLVDDVYQEYLRWAEHEGLASPWTKRRLSSELFQRLAAQGVSRDRQTVDGRQARCFVGLSLASTLALDAS